MCKGIEKCQRKQTHSQQTTQHTHNTHSAKLTFTRKRSGSRTHKNTGNKKTIKSTELRQPTMQQTHQSQEKKTNTKKITALKPTRIRILVQIKGNNPYFRITNSHFMSKAIYYPFIKIDIKSKYWNIQSI